MFGAILTCDQVSVKEARGDLGIGGRHATINFFDIAKRYRAAFPVSSYCEEVAQVERQRFAGANLVKVVHCARIRASSDLSTMLELSQFGGGGKWISGTKVRSRIVCVRDVSL